MADEIDSLPGEIWKPVPGYEKEYQVSSLGRVKTNDKWVNSKNGSFALKRAKMMRPHTSARTGYVSVSLAKDGEKRTTNIHAMVCAAFHGPRPAPGMQVAHNDGTRNNNRADNLRWDTAHGNSLDRMKHGTQQHGAEQHLAKLTDADVVKMRSLYTGRRGDLQILSRQFGITPTQAMNIVKRRQWKHI